MKSHNAAATREAAFQAKAAMHVQQCRHCGRWSDRLKRGGICPRCDVLRTTAPGLEQKRRPRLANRQIEGRVDFLMRAGFLSGAH
jgi:hypothetical protein